MDTAALISRLEAVEDRLALIDIEGTYARAFDAHNGAGWAMLFTGDGIYQSRGATADGGGTFVQGRANLEAFCTDAPFAGIHYMHLPEIRIDGDTATARVHLEFIGAFESKGRPVSRTIGYYDVSYARVDGRWLIKRRVTTVFAREEASAFGYPD